MLFLAACVIALLLEGVFHLDIAGRTTVFWTLMLLAAGLLGWFVARPLLRFLGVLQHETDIATARWVGVRISRVGDRLVNVMQLFRQRQTGGPFSSELVDAAVEDARKEFAPLDLTSGVDMSGPLRVAKLLGLTVVGSVLLLVLFPATFSGAAIRLLHHSQSFVPPTTLRFVVDPGDKEVLKGANVSIRVRVEGESRTIIALSSKPEGQLQYETRMLHAAPDGMFTDELRALKLTTRYYVHSGELHSPEFTLKVVNRPVVKLLRIHLQPPLYSALPPKQLDENQGDITALKGTRVTFLVESSKSLSSAAITLGAAARRDLRVDGHRATGELTLSKEDTYQITLKDEEGITNTDLITYSIKLIPDAYPTASILLPGRNVDIAENEQLSMQFRIADDYGFTRLRLAYKLVQSRYEKPAQEFTYVAVPLPVDTRTEATIPYLWSLSGVHLVPEDVVSYFIEVFDNDNVSGPKAAASETYLLRLPSLEEVFADLDKGHEANLETMQQALKEAQAAKEALDELQREMKKEQQKLDWQDQKKAEEMLKKYEGIQNKLGEVNKTVEQMVNEMSRNQVLSPETLEKYQELQQLMQQMSAPEFAEAMKRLQQAMQQLSPQQLRQALEQFSFSEENFRKSIERTINLLKRVQIEQKVDEALQRAKQLTERQEEVQRQTEKLRSEDTEGRKELTEQQMEIKEQLDHLRDQLSELQKQMEEFPTEMPLSELQEAKDQLQQSGLQQDLDDVVQQMQAQQMQQAMQGQKGALQKMGDFMQRLQKMQNAMRENQQRQIVNNMRRALQDLLDLSKRQEQLKGDSQGLERNSQRFREAGQEQMQALQDLSSIANNLARLSQKTFSITPEMGKALGDAGRKMSQAMQALEQRDGSAAGQQQSGAMASLNEAAQLMQGAMDALMQGGGQGMGMAGFMQRLQQLSGMQQGINQGTQNLGGLSPQQAAEMARLAGEQGMVRKSLEELTKEAAQAGQLNRLLGDLNSIAQEMREVQTDLAQGNINPETLRKQDRILSRLLDSQRSMHERDYEKRRKSQPGIEQLRPSPDQTDTARKNDQNRLREDLLKALDEGYARDYQELIKEYFEALERSERQQ